MAHVDETFITYFNETFFYFLVYEAKVNLKSRPWRPTWGSSAYTPETLHTHTSAMNSCVYLSV